MSNVHAIPDLAQVMDVQSGRNRSVNFFPCPSVSHCTADLPVAVAVLASSPPVATEVIFLHVLTDNDALHMAALPMQTICISTPLEVSWWSGQGWATRSLDGHREPVRPVDSGGVTPSAYG